MMIIKLNRAYEKKPIFTFGANKTGTEVPISIYLSLTPNNDIRDQQAQR